MGLPSGLLWATRNIDATQDNGFAASEYQYECSYFSWGNIDAHNPTSSTSFVPWSWGSSDDGEPYASSPGAAIPFPGSLPSEQDAARAICGKPWKIPTEDEIAELLANVDYIDENGEVIPDERVDKRSVVNGIRGIRLRSQINGSILFIACCGRGDIGTLGRLSISGYVWSSTLLSSSEVSALAFGETSSPGLIIRSRHEGLPIRPVFKRSSR